MTETLALVKPAIEHRDEYLAMVDEVVAELGYYSHAGYDIRPSLRGRGYATRQLALLLTEARSAGLPGLLLPVEGENPASMRVIEKNGGRFLRDAAPLDDGTPVHCYWIALGGA